MKEVKEKKRRVERSYQVGYRLYPNYKAYGASATPSQLTSIYSYQTQPMLVVAYQTMGHNLHRNECTEKQEEGPR